MSEVAQLSISNLLSQVGIVKKKYDDLAAYTGENYNLFNVLGIYQDELSHSAIIGDLLNAKGKHGQKDTFLKLFLEELPSFDEDSEQFRVLNNFKSESSKVYIERHIGKVDFDKGEGGRIDILINDGKNNIIIENKVWAGDQYLQLVRYNNQDKNAPILYLTLDGKEPSNDSKDYLILGKEFICLSYKVEIVRWLENCIREMANKPIIRESLNQYLVLVKQLTHQSSNNIMKDIVNLIFNNNTNFESAKLVCSTLNSIENNLINKLDLIVKNGESQSTKLNNSIKNNSLFKRINIVHRFNYEGVKMIRFDIVTNDEPKNYQCIAIQLEVLDYKIRNFVWANDKDIEAKLYGRLVDNLNFYYEFEESAENIVLKIEEQIKSITSIF